MNDDPLKDFDYFAEGATEKAQEMCRTHNAELTPQRRAIAELLPPEHHEAFYAMLNTARLVFRIEGAQHALSRLGKMRRQAVHAAEREAALRRVEVGRERGAAHNALQAENKQLRQETARLQREVDRLTLNQIPAGLMPSLPSGQRAHQTPGRGAPPFQFKPLNQPTWDYPEAERRRLNRNEVAPACPQPVADVARQVEEYVMRHGKVSKTDVSAALPHARPYLSDAYRHLHASRRVHVNGWALQPWPKNGQPTKESA